MPFSHSREPRPRRSTAPGARLWRNTSAFAAVFPDGFRRGMLTSRARLSFERFTHTKWDERPWTVRSYARAASPTWGRSILITRAPSSASWRSRTAGDHLLERDDGDSFRGFMKNEGESAKRQARQLRMPGLPRRDGMRIGEHPRGDDFARGEGRGFRLPFQNVDQKPQGGERTAEHIGADAAIGEALALEQPRFGEGQFFHQPRDIIHLDGSPHNQPAMQPVVGRAIRDRDLPVGVVALDDLHRMRDPFDAGKELGNIARLWWTMQLEADLRLDARLREPLEPHFGAIALCLNQAAVVDHAPHRLVDAVARPQGAVGKADLATRRLPSSRQAMRMQRARPRIAGFGREARVAFAEARNDPRRFVHLHQPSPQHAAI